MKKNILKFLAIVMIVISMSSCATLFGGQVGACQRTKPVAGQPARQLRVVPLVLDILVFWPSVIVDFGTSAIYVPCDKK